MEKIEHYRTCIETLLERESHYKSQGEDVESQLFFDPVRHHYQVMRVGWQGLNRVYHTMMHFDIREDKIWIQQNTTDLDVGEALVEMGVPKEDIVLGLHPPYKRPYTGYGDSAIPQGSAELQATLLNPYKV